jgi:hypothetical protein
MFEDDLDPTAPIQICGKWFFWDAQSRRHRPAEDSPAPKPGRKRSWERREEADCNHASGQAADVELPASGKRVGKGTRAAFDSRVSITIVSYRSRLADSDGISAKAAIDGLVACGILADDSAKEVEEVRYRQVKVKNESEEKTEIVIQQV